MCITDQELATFVPLVTNLSIFSGNAKETTNNQVKRAKTDDMSTFDNDFKEQNYNGIPYLQLGSSVTEREVDDARVFQNALLNNDHQDHASYHRVPYKRENLGDSDFNDAHNFGGNVRSFVKRQEHKEGHPLKDVIMRTIFHNSVVGKRDRDDDHRFVGKQASEFGYRFVGKRSPGFSQSFVGKRDEKIYISVKEYLEELRKCTGDLYYGKRAEDSDYILPENLHEMNPFIRKRAVACLGRRSIGVPYFEVKQSLRSDPRFVEKDAPGLKRSFVEKSAPGSSHSLTRKREDVTSVDGDTGAEGGLTSADFVDFSGFPLSDKSANGQLGGAANND